MKTAYEPDNTRSSIVILVSLGIIVSVIVAIFGLSDKPEVSTIAVAPGADFDVASVTTSIVTEAPRPDIPTTDADATEDSVTEDEGEAEREVIVVPTLEPTATPEVAAAVEPTAVPDAEETTDSATGEVIPAASLPTSSGSVQGSFFTASDENDGAIVSQNAITISFDEEAQGDFTGVLEISYPDGTNILLNMSGPVIWTTANPAVEADVAGTFTLDAPVDADDLTTDDAQLSITSLINGSGSLCTTRCFGFTFPPP